MSGDAIDGELLALQNRLKAIQKEIGGAKEKSKGFYHDGKMDRFLDVFAQMSERLETIKNCIEEIRKLEKVPGSNPTELISNQSKVRSELNSLGDEYKELEMLQRLESKKRRSRYSPEELKDRHEKVVFMQTSIQDIKDLQRSGFVKAYTANRLVKMEDSEMFKKRDIEMGSVRKNADGM
jgi:DNA repair ATPase RecN